MEVFSLCQGNALCVHVADTYGVVCLISGVAKCVTCKFGTHTCVHVNRRKVLLQNGDVPIIPLLEKYAVDLTHQIKEKSSQTCLSRALIPLNFSEAQQTTMKKCAQERLNVVDGVSCLVPDEDVCAMCNANNWGALQPVRECNVVIGYELLLAKGELYSHVLQLLCVLAGLTSTIYF